MMELKPSTDAACELLQLCSSWASKRHDSDVIALLLT
jgi:hypothetical protein